MAYANDRAQEAFGDFLADETDFEYIGYLPSERASAFYVSKFALDYFIDDIKRFQLDAFVREEFPEWMENDEHYDWGYWTEDDNGDFIVYVQLFVLNNRDMREIFIKAIEAFGVPYTITYDQGNMILAQVDFSDIFFWSK